MKNSTSKIFIVFILASLALSSCATGYDRIQPQLLNYVSTSKALENVELKYKYDVLTKKYKKKEENSGVRIVAVQISNNSDKAFTFGEDVALVYDNGNTTVILDREKAIREIKQTVPTYLLYLLLTPMNLTTTRTGNGFIEETSSTPIGLVVGPALTAINVFTASGANKKLKAELADNELMGQVIKPGDVTIGLIALRSNTYDSLKLVRTN